VGREWERVEEGEVSLLETKVDGSFHSKEGFQVSIGTKKGSKGNRQGEIKEQGDCAIYVVTCICVYNNCWI
jgi:hypothetical protein